MTAAYKRIFWGIFIATFRITVGIITILPAFIGWIIVVTGLSRLERNSTGADFSIPKKGAMILVAASFVGLFLPPLFYPLFVIAIELVVFHKLFEVVVYNFDVMDQQDAVDKYTRKDRSYIIFMGITMVLLLISLTFNHLITGLLATIMAIISRIYLLTVISSLRKENYKMT